MFCTICATRNPVAAHQCRICGTGLPALLPGTGRGQRAGKRRHLALTLLYGVPIVLLLAASLSYYRATWRDSATWYAEAEAAIATGDYAGAIDLFATAGDFRDAASRHASLAAEMAVHQASYDAAATALDDGRYDDAIALIAPTVRSWPSDAAAEVLAQARQMRIDVLRRTVDAAARQGEWLQAERALDAQVAADPGDSAAREELATLRREHAPIVFTRDHALYLVSPDGMDERLVTDRVPVAWPSWSPDRTRIAFASPETNGQNGLYLIDADGANLVRIAGDLRDYSGPVWSPDGTRIAFATGGGGTERMGQSEPDPDGLAVVDVATRRLLKLIPNAFSPAWSPSGDRLAYVRRAPESFTFDSAPIDGRPAPTGDVLILTLATNRTKNITDRRILHPWRVAWSPVDERMLVYTRDPGSSYDRDRTRLTLLNAATGAMSEVSTFRDRITMPVWSPDGARIAYVAGEETLVVRELEGRSERIDLDVVLSRYVSWGPSGDTLIAAAEGSIRSSYIIALEGDAVTATPFSLDYDTDRRASGAPQWSPSHLIFAAPRPSIAGTGLDRDDRSPPAAGIGSLPRDATTVAAQSRFDRDPVE